MSPNPVSTNAAVTAEAVLDLLAAAAAEHCDEDLSEEPLGALEAALENINVIGGRLVLDFPAHRVVLTAKVFTRHDGTGS